MTTKCIISGYGYSDNKQYLQLDNLTNKGPKRSRVIISDKIIKIVSKKEEKICTGRYDILNHESEPCPLKSRIDKKFNNCFECREYIGFNPAFYNASEISEKQREYNKQPHNLYLAHFGSGVVKVGISHNKRIQKRLMEQGARTAIILGEFPNAYKAREIEEKISGIDGINEIVRNNIKINFLSKYYDKDNAKNEIKETINKINKLLDYKFSLEYNFKIYDDIYFSNNFSTNLDNFNDYSKNEIINIEGLVTGLCGNNLVLLNNDNFIIPIKKLIGYIIEIDIRKNDMSFKETGQQTLI